MRKEAMCSVLEKHKDELSEGWWDGDTHHCLLGWCLSDKGIDDHWILQLEDGHNLWAEASREDDDIHDQKRHARFVECKKILADFYGLTPDIIDRIITINDTSSDEERYEKLKAYLECTT